MKKNVLVFPCGSEIGLEIHKSLGLSTHFNLIGGSSVDDHGKFVYKNYLGDLPFFNDPEFVKKINETVDKHKIDFILSAHDGVILQLAQAKARGELACELVTSPLETCEIACSKLKTYQFFNGVIPTPRVYQNVGELKPADLPVFLKPEVGNGSRGVQIAKTIEDARFYTKKDPSLLLLEYLPGKEYTVDCFTNKDGKLLFCEGRERSRIMNGISVNSVTVKDERFSKLADKINQKLKFRGVWFFQVKERANGELVLMEIAPRIAGTMGLVRCKGVNLVLLSLFDALGYDVAVFENDYEMVIDRALQNSYKHDMTYKHVYLDFDDLVIFEGKVNPTVMAFVYQCLNRQIKVHLLTRHTQDLEQSLKKYRLSNVFDELIWIKDDSEKPGYIEEKDAIFIDDSFAERKKVHETCGIPVFDAHMIESLMEEF
ncbi:MAG TPA: ATP-grasp domain-containing protein [Candidatus Saccharimonadales bacterium]|nr:ATP-grasp domain-containing protein [Candidatus Saccharimonadales bacterium]